MSNLNNHWLPQQKSITATERQRRKAGRLGYDHRLFHSSRPSYDNWFSGLAEIGIGCSLGVLWSECSIFRTGCGPIQLSDKLERICYQGVIVVAGLALFNRIVTTSFLFDIDHRSNKDTTNANNNNKNWSSSTGSSNNKLAIIASSSSLLETLEERFGTLQSWTQWQVQISEVFSMLAVVGALVILALQYSRGTTMDGFSGIDADLCRAIRDLE